MPESPRVAAPGVNVACGSVDSGNTSSRSTDELEILCDYIHYNPVKHGHAASPAEWPWSTFERFVAGGDYPPDLGRVPVRRSFDAVASIVGE